MPGPRGRALSVRRLNTMRRVTEPIRVVYVVPRFPVLSQSFVLTEFDRVRREVPAEIAALFSSREPVVHPIAAELLPSVIFVPLASFSAIRSNVKWLMRRPARYLATLGRALRGSFRRPAGGVARGAVVFVKAVALMDKVIDLKATHIHAHFIHHPATAAWVINRLSGIPFSVTAHADDLYCGPALFEEKTRAAAAVVTISEYNRQYIRERTRGACEPPVIHCGIPLELFPYRPRERCRRFVCVARLEPKKGHADLVRAFAVAAAKAPDLSLELVGDGAEHARVADLVCTLGIENLVHFHGAMASHAVRELLEHCDAFVLAAVRTRSTSFQRGYMDGIPVALMEAMACGLPVISTSISGIPELVVGCAGVLVSPGDVSALAQAILDVHRDPALGASRARRARRHVEQHFDADAEAGKLVELFVAGASSYQNRTPADATLPN